LGYLVSVTWYVVLKYVAEVVIKHSNVLSDDDMHMISNNPHSIRLESVSSIYIKIGKLVLNSLQELQLLNL